MKNRLIFLRVPPDHLHEWPNEDFEINPDIPIPLEIPEKDENNPVFPLTMENIQIGLLRAIEEKQAEQEWIDYYCNLLLYLCPDIITKLKEIKDDCHTDKNYLTAYNMVKDGSAEQALDIIREFIECHPLVWNGWFILGWALRLLGRWQDAAASLRKAIELGGDNSDTKNELAICLMETGDIDSAKQELETALKNDPENVKLLSNAGVLALRTNGKESAGVFFRKVLEIDSEDPLAKSFFES